MAIANPAPLGVLAFGVSCFVSGLYFMGVDNEPAEGAAKTVAYTQIMCGVTLLLVAVLFVLGSQPVNGAFALWASAIFGFFGYLWIVLGLIVLKGGDLKPFSSYLIFTCICVFVWFIHSIQLKAASFAVLFFFATLGTLLAWIGIRGWWGKAVKFAGICFFVLGFVGLYIGLWEMMTKQGIDVLLKG